MPLRPGERQRVFESFAGQAITNSHNAMKQVWVVIFSAGTFSLIKSFDDLVRCDRLVATREPGVLEGCHGVLSRLDRPEFVLLCVLYVSYILTFYRFYVGNIRMFDMRYVERGEFVRGLARQDPGSEAYHYTKLFSQIDKNSRFENFYLLFKTFVIISLTLYVNSPRVFIEIYAVLLMLDLLWMALVRARRMWNWFRYRVTGQGALVAEDDFRELFYQHLGLDDMAWQATLSRTERGKLHGIGRMFPDRAILIWAWNNSIVLGSLLLIYHSRSMLSHDEFHWIGAGLIFANCCIDIVLAWRFYNPRFSEAYRFASRGDFLAESPDTTRLPESPSAE